MYFTVQPVFDIVGAGDVDRFETIDTTTFGSAVPEKQLRDFSVFPKDGESDDKLMILHASFLLLLSTAPCLHLDSHFQFNCICVYTT